MNYRILMHLDRDEFSDGSLPPAATNLCIALSVVFLEVRISSPGSDVMYVDFF